MFGRIFKGEKLLEEIRKMEWTWLYKPIGTLLSHNNRLKFM